METVLTQLSRVGYPEGSTLWHNELGCWLRKHSIHAASEAFTLSHLMDISK